MQRNHNLPNETVSRRLLLLEVRRVRRWRCTATKCCRSCHGTACDFGVRNGGTNSAALRTSRTCLRLCGSCVTSCTSFFRAGGLVGYTAWSQPYADSADLWDNCRVTFMWADYFVVDLVNVNRCLLRLRPSTATLAFSRWYTSVDVATK